MKKIETICMKVTKEDKEKWQKESKYVGRPLSNWIHWIVQQHLSRGE